MKIEHYIANDDIGRTVGWFVKENIFKHGDDVQDWIKKDKPVFTPDQFDYVLKLSDSEEWQEKFCMIVSTYYGVSSNYDQADSRFQVAIPQYIKLFNKEAIKYLAGQIENNSQCHDRSRARHDYEVIKFRIDELFGSEFDYSGYYWFGRKLGLAD